MLLAVAGLSAEEKRPEVLKDVAIVERLGNFLPQSIEVSDARGKKQLLTQYFNTGRPVVFTLAYYNCPMLCNLILEGLTESVNGLPFNLEEKAEIVTLSIDPQETTKAAQAFKEKYVSLVTKGAIEKYWHFLTATPDVIKTVTEALGYYYKPDGKGDFAHQAAVFILSPEGKISRYLYGIEYPSFDLSMAIVEAASGKERSTVEKILMYCYAYNPDDQGYVLQAIRVMRLAGMMTVVGIVSFVLVLMIKRKRKRV